MDDLPAFDHGVSRTDAELDGRPVERITLSNGHITATILTLIVLPTFAARASAKARKAEA